VVDELVGADINVARMLRVIFDSTEDLQVEAQPA
jgi:hypothetical protein